MRRIGAGGGHVRVVTFESFHDDEGFDRTGFGEEFFLAHGIGAIHVLTRTNRWYQYREMPAALRAIRAALGTAQRVLTYGSSMGGYAAIRFAGALGADAVLALSPQYSIDRRRVPFERRWLEEQRRIGRTRERAIESNARVVIAYDPRFAQDRRHIDLIAAEAPVVRLPLPFGGHPVGGFLVELGLLQPLVLDLLEGGGDVSAVARAARRGRALSPIWLGQLAGHQPAWRPRLGVALAERAVAIGPRSSAAHHALAIRLREAGRYEEALARHRHTSAIDPAPSLKWDYCRTAFAAGDLPLALAVARELQRDAPMVAGPYNWTAGVRLLMGDRDGAIADMRAAVARAPRNRAYRWALAKLTMRRRAAALRRALTMLRQRLGGG